MLGTKIQLTCLPHRERALPEPLRLTRPLTVALASFGSRPAEVLVFVFWFPGILLLPRRNSSIRPGVPMMMSAPWARNVATGSEDPDSVCALDPPMTSSGGRNTVACLWIDVDFVAVELSPAGGSSDDPGCAAMKDETTEWI